MKKKEKGNKNIVGLVIFISIFTMILTGAVVSGIKYYFGKDNVLYSEAKELEAQGDIYGAHDKITEALTINPTNRKVITYKAQLYNMVDNNDKLKLAAKLRKEAVSAMDRGDYILAAEKLDKANDTIYNISPSASSYDKIQELKEQRVNSFLSKIHLDKFFSKQEEQKVSKVFLESQELQVLIQDDIKRLERELPERYYNKAIELSNSGEDERAYSALLYVKKTNPKIDALKDELAFKIGSRQLKSIDSMPDPTIFEIKDTIDWFSKVSPNSPNYIDAKSKIANLKNKLEIVEKNKKE